MGNDVILREIGRDLSLLRDSAQDLNRVYTANHPQGQLQWKVNVDRIADAVETGVDEQDARRVLLEAIVDNTGHIPSFAEGIRDLISLNTHQLGVSLTSLALEQRSLDYLADIDLTLEDIGATLESIEDGVWCAVEELEEVNVHLTSIDSSLIGIDSGVEELNKKAEETNKHLKDIKVIGLLHISP